MSRTTKTKTITQTARGNSRGRTRKKRHGRQTSRRSTTNGPEIIADSVYTLRLNSIPSVVFDIQELQQSFQRGTNYEKMYHDLRACLIAAFKIKGENSEMDPLAWGMSLSASLQIVTNVFKNNILPAGYKVNIDYNKYSKDYFFTMYKVVDAQEYWRYFPIRRVVQHLEKKNKKLHDAFVMVLSGLREGAGICTWFGGYVWGYEHVVNDTQEALMYVQDRYDDEEEAKRAAQELIDEAKDYKNGEANRYAKYITKTSYKREKVLSDIKGMRGQWLPFVKWIQDAVDIIDDNCNIWNLDYQNGDFDYDDGCVQIFQTITILWDDDDYVFYNERDFVDNEAANFGVAWPIVHFVVKPETKSIPYESFPVQEKWYDKISKLFHSFHEIVEKLPKDVQ